MEDCNCSRARKGRTPTGHDGFWVYPNGVSRERRGYNGDKQIWKFWGTLIMGELGKEEERPVYIGMWCDWRPQPVDLARKFICPGSLIEIAGKNWIYPEPTTPLPVAVDIDLWGEMDVDEKVEIALQGLSINYKIGNTEADLLGFFSDSYSINALVIAFQNLMGRFQWLASKK